MSNEHTPGPWRTSPANKGIGDRDMFVMADKPEGQAELAKVYDWAEYGGALPAEANARLIAAAPETKKQRDELLWTLEYVRGELSGWTTSLGLTEVLRVIDSVIDKATKENK